MSWLLRDTRDILLHAFLASAGPYAPSMIVLDQRGRISSAQWARARLRAIVAQDREAVPCGRWVRRPSRLQEAAEFVAFGVVTLTWPMSAVTHRSFSWPRYRWEPRR